MSAEHPGLYSDQMPLPNMFMRVAMIAREKVSNRVSKEKWFTKEHLRLHCIGVLHGIAKMEPVSQKDVAKWAGIDPGDLVGILDQLENAGYIKRNRDSQDRRRQLLSLTKQGSVATQKLIRIGSESIDEILAPLKDVERTALRSMLTRVVEHHELEEQKKES